jgi:DNA invertase Pin-like site-specific DNA recombinase
MPRPRARMVAGGGSQTPSFVAYYRVSTDQQGRSGLGLDAQKAAVAKYVASSDGKIESEFEEVESGSRDDRPQLALALAACRARRATLILAKLDRLARNTSFLLSVVHGAGEAGVVFCDLPQLPPGPAGAFILTMFAAVAELERGLISQRTKAALAAAKARGVRLGSRTLSRGFDTAMSRAGRQAQTVRSKAHAADVQPYVDAARKAGAVTLREIAAALTARGIQPPSGGECWHANQVRRIVLAAPPVPPLNSLDTDLLRALHGLGTAVARAARGAG